MSDADATADADQSTATTTGDADQSTAATAADAAASRPDTVLITGCSSGIGRATARAFREEGWTVYATARDTDDLQALADAGCETAALDVTEQADVERVVERVVDEQGHIDCLVNNAGYAQMGPVEDVSVEEMQAQFDVNLYGPHRLVRAALPHMREAEDGTIVNLSSVVGRLAFPGGGVYSASKFAVEGYSDALRVEADGFGVDVVVVEPGPVDTGFYDRADDELDGRERTDAYDRIYDTMDDYDAVGGPVPTSTTAEDVAAVVLNAASCTSPAARYPVGPVATWAMRLRFLPDGVRDRLFRVGLKLLG
jgi:NAD(P)-dependent dehydrogenase (short-subunit alcohol dehydrogenase family)